MGRLRSCHETESLLSCCASPSVLERVWSKLLWGAEGAGVPHTTLGAWYHVRATR
jgi:hypothetical protein